MGPAVKHVSSIIKRYIKAYLWTYVQLHNQLNETIEAHLHHNRNLYVDWNELYKLSSQLCVNWIGTKHITKKPTPTEAVDGVKSEF